MNSSEERQLGFNTLAIIIILLIAIIILGFVAWRLMNVNQAQQDPQSSTDQNQNQNSDEQQKKSQENLLKIPELGIEFEIKENIELVYEVVRDNLQEGQVANMPVSTKEVTERGGECNFANESSGRFALITMWVFSTEDAAVEAISDPNPSTPRADKSELTEANGFYRVGDEIFYIPDGVRGGVSECEVENQELVNKQRQLLRDSLITVKSSN